MVGLIGERNTVLKMEIHYANEVFNKFETNFFEKKERMRKSSQYSLEFFDRSGRRLQFFMKKVKRLQSLAKRIQCLQFFPKKIKRLRFLAKRTQRLQFLAKRAKRLKFFAKRHNAWNSLQEELGILCEKS